MNPKDGVIKFKLEWEKCQISIPKDIFNELNNCRNILRGKNLLGVYNDGIGYGNISYRANSENHFYISGSTTSDLFGAELRHYSRVTYFIIEANKLYCRGLTKASSESMTHGAIYSTCKDINCIIHIHSRELWKKWIGKLPTTSKEIEYGTPEMALAIKEFVKNPEVKEKGIIIMGGHEEGIVSFGRSIRDAMIFIQSL